MSAQTDDADVMAALTDCLQRLSNRSTSPVDTASSSVVEPLVRAVYAQRDGRPLWRGSTGGVTADAAIRALHALDAHGLDPRDYASDSWGRLRESGDPASIAELDVTLTGAWLRAMVHAHRGRVDPRELGYAYSVPPKAADYPALLIRAVEGSRLTELIETLEPNLPQFRRLEAHLVRYRALASWSPPPLSAPATKVSPGDTFETTEPLSALLTALGDLPPDAAAERRLYSGALVDAVERFQERHGLDVDGVLGKRTWRQLSTPLAARVRQIELSLERMRWLPAFAPGHVLIVNLPDFHVYGFDSVDNDRPEVQLDVVIGKAAGSRTPLFAETLRYLIVRPYWHVPRSIVEQEIIPELRRNPSYLERNALDLVSRPSDDAPAVAWTDESLEGLRRGRLFLRQRPGPANALGRLKFVFPNRYDVYMHDTPATALFARARRDFSHGCIRVQHPETLAMFVLQSQPAWTRERLLDAMNGTRTFRVDVVPPLPVYVFYATAIGRADGSVVFLEDLYGHDATLDGALRTLTPASTAP